MTPKTALIPSLAVLITLANLGRCEFAHHYGVPCDGHVIKCNPDKNFACWYDRCLCTIPDDMMYDKWHQKCVSLIGRSCNSTDKGYTCIDNAHCNSEGKCECVGYSFPTSEGYFCATKKSTGMKCSNENECNHDSDHLYCVKGVCLHGNATYGDPCGTNNPCNLKANLVCNNGTCNCPLPIDVMLFNKTRQECLIRAGATCGIRKAYCVEDAYCLPVAGSPGSQCVCYSRHTFANSEGHCVPKKLDGENCTSNDQCQRTERLSCVKGICTRSMASHGDSCGDNVHCDPRSESLLTCSNNRCQCKSGTIFDKNRKICVVPINKSCFDENEYELPCVNNALCDLEFGTCACNGYEGYYATVDGFCHLKEKFGGNCTRDYECSEKLLLACVSGVCTCNPKEYILDPTRKICGRRAGTNCNKGDACTANSKCSKECCQCLKGYRNREDGQCGIKNGGKCEGNDLCGDGLACLKGICGCPAPQKFDKQMGKCRSGVK